MCLGEAILIVMVTKVMAQTVTCVREDRWKGTPTQTKTNFRAIFFAF
jgi:hypothetical protein